MNTIERVEPQGQLLALILRCGIGEKGAKFFTDSNNPLQIGILQHGQGTELKSHIHRRIIRTIENTQEVLHIEHGEVEVNFYNEGGEKVAQSVLTCGDTILLINGGHGFRILKDAKILEIKQGPYDPEGDKTFF